jgi:hypothetical protein
MAWKPEYAENRRLREEAGRRIEAECTNVPFISIDDVMHRCDLRDDEMETLAHLGAFAGFGCTRRWSGG